jgi:hypothetical protein
LIEKNDFDHLVTHLIIIEPNHAIIHPNFIRRKRCITFPSALALLDPQCHHWGFELMLLGVPASLGWSHQKVVHWR